MKDTMRNYDNIKIAVVGMGYVGLSLAIMLQCTSGISYHLVYDTLLKKIST